MPRNASGTYSLPAGNPVVSGSVISSTWANPTLADVANELTNSLSRNGQGGMLVPFEFTNGTFGAPGITWASETSTGFYRPATSDMRATVAGIPRMRWTNVGVDVWDPVAAGGSWVPLVNAGGVNFIPSTGGTMLNLNITNSGVIGNDLSIGDDLTVVGDLTVGGATSLQALTATSINAGSEIITGASLSLRKAVVASFVGIRWDNELGVTKWWMYEAADTNDSLTLSRYNDAGSYLGDPFAINSLTGTVVFGSNDVLLNGSPSTLGSVLTLIQDSGNGPMMLLQNRLQTAANHKIGSIVFAPFRDVANPVYGAAMWAEAVTPAGYAINLYLGAQDNLPSSTYPTQPQVQINSSAVSVLGGIPFQLTNSALSVVRGLYMNTANEISLVGRGGVLHMNDPVNTGGKVHASTGTPGAYVGNEGEIWLQYT
jgi:hypothetical protein